MHNGSLVRMKWFVDNYIKTALTTSKRKILDVGSYDVNGSYYQLLENIPNIEYIGLDMSDGPNVNYVPSDPYDWKELENCSFDYIISGNAFEHIEFPWLTICQIYKKLKDKGFVCIIAPNSLEEHRYPVDCYRYYSDGFAALAKWAGFEVINVTVGGIPDENCPLEYYAEGYNDTMMILTKGLKKEEILKFPKLNMERRYNRANEMDLKYEFLLKWIKDDNKANTLNGFFKERGVERVYLYGYGRVGIILLEELKKISGIDLFIMDKFKKDSSEVELLHPGDVINEEKGSCILNSLMSYNVLVELDRFYPRIKKYNVNEIYGI